VGTAILLKKRNTANLILVSQPANHHKKYKYHYLAFTRKQCYHASMLTQRFEKALTYAFHLHNGQQRKGSGVPR
jgi:hypothetical protein